ncbi:MAG: DUF4097 family beta strand repeat-containing protein [bacterium]|nr:DUF4097 family beta strand repeat-containing protein [bacterium]
MNKAQTIIKYAAIAFAIYLICEIFLILINIVGVVDKGFESKNKKIDVPASEAYLVVDLATSSLTIKEGDTFNYTIDNNEISAEKDNNKIIIKEKGHFRNKKSEVIITIPRDMILNDAIINTGAGKINIENLKTENLILDIGAGSVQIDNITVTKNCDIDGGVGNMVINKGSIYNLDMDLGVGKTTITSTLTGENEIDTGIGKLELNLIGTLNDYTLDISKGIGSITLDDKNLKDEEKIGTGSSQVKIDGGIGAIDIKMKEE